MYNPAQIKAEFKANVEKKLKEKMIANTNIIKNQNASPEDEIIPQHNSHHSEKNTTILIYDFPCNDDGSSCDTFNIVLPIWGRKYWLIWGPGVDDREFINNHTTYGNFPHINNLSGGRRYTIKIYGKVERFGFRVEDVEPFDNGCQGIEYLVEVVKIGPSKLTYAFLGASNLVKVPKKLPCDVKDLSGMFAGCTSFNYPINCWDVSDVRHMYVMFFNAAKFNQPLDKWDTHKVLTMIGMFAGAMEFNQPLNSWDVSAVTSMSGMFNTAVKFNQPLDKWNTHSVADMSFMFTGATSFNQPLFGTNIEDIFIVGNVLSSVTNMSNMFCFAISFNQPLDLWLGGYNKLDTILPLVIPPIDVSGMFAFAKNFNQPIQNWDTSYVSNMYGMFFDATSFNQPINNWNVSNVTDMRYMFSFASSFNQSLHLWNIRNISQGSNLGAKNMLDYCGMSQYNWQTTLIGWWSSCKATPPRQPVVGAYGLLYNKYYNWQVYGNVDGNANSGNGNLDTTAVWEEAGNANNQYKSLVRRAVEYFTNITGHMEINYDT